MSAWKEVGTAAIAFAVSALPTSLSAGEIGQTSRASALISVTIPSRLQVNGVEDVSLAQIGARESLSQRLCVLTSAAEGAYSVTWLSPPTRGNASPNQDDAEPPLVMEWADHRATTARIVPGLTVGGFQAFGNDCPESGDGAAYLTVRVVKGSHPSLESLPPALTLLVAPE